MNCEWQFYPIGKTSKKNFILNSVSKTTSKKKLIQVIWTRERGNRRRLSAKSNLNFVVVVVLFQFSKQKIWFPNFSNQIKQVSVVKCRCVCVCIEN